MNKQGIRRADKFVSLTLAAALGSLIMLVTPVQAATSESGSVGIQGVLPSAPPSRGATIAVPGSGASFSELPITVSGLCPADLLVKVFANNIFVGSAVCSRGSYTLQANLFSGRNDLVARVYDALDQAGPDSNTVTVTFRDGQFLPAANRVSLRSDYAQRGAPPGALLEWPVIVEDGTGPYAISVDWGDGTPSDLFTALGAGPVTLKHVYRSAGLYRVLVRASDKNGQAAFLQLVGQATGAIQSQDQPKPPQLIERRVTWWPSLFTMPLLAVAFWLGGQHRLAELRKRSRVFQ